MGWLDNQAADVLRPLLHAAPDAILVVDVHGAIMFANEQTTELFGWTPDELVGGPLEVLLPEAVRADHARMMRAFLGRPQLRPMGSGLGIEGRHRDGHTFPLDIKLSPLETEQGRVVVAVARDIRHLTAQQDRLADQARALEVANADLRQLNEEKARFLGIAAHDLRNPLTAVMGYADLLLAQLDGQATAYQLGSLTKIRQTAHFMAALVNDLLDFAAIEAGRLRLERVPVDMLEVVRETTTLLGPLAARKQIRLTTQLPTAVGSVSADRIKTEQVLHNLVDNAVKFSAAGTTIQVGVRGESGSVVTWVADQGPGIPADEAALLFKPFERTSVRSTNGELSTGLGLAIVKRIVDGHGGRIWVDSEVGRGSTFHVSLPVLSG